MRIRGDNGQRSRSIVSVREERERFFVRQVELHAKATAPAVQEVMLRVVQVSLAVMCPAC